MIFAPFSFLNQATIPSEIASGSLFYVNGAIINSYPGSGSTWFDISGNNRNVSLVGGVVASGSNSLDFSGGEYGFIPTASALDVLSATSSFSIITVFYSDVTPSGVSQVFTKNQLTPNYMGWAIGYNTFTGGSEGRFGFDFLGETAGAQKRINVEFSSSSSFGLPSRWSHFGVTYNGNANASGIKFYINGISSSAAIQYNSNNFTTAVNPKTTQEVVVAGRAGNQTLDGRIGALLFYDRLLSSNEMLGIYNYLSSSFTN